MSRICCGSLPKFSKLFSLWSMDCLFHRFHENPLITINYCANKNSQSSSRQKVGIGNSNVICTAAWSLRSQRRWMITFRVSRKWREMYVGHARLSVSVSVYLSVCPSPHARTTTRTRMQLWGMIGVPPNCALLGRFFSRWRSFVAVTT